MIERGLKLFAELPSLKEPTTIGNKRRAIELQPVDEELSLRRDSDEPTVIALPQVCPKIISPRMEQPHVRRVVLVPVRPLVLVAPRARVDEVVTSLVPTTDTRPMMVDRQSRACVVFMNAAIRAAPGEPFADVRTEQIVQGRATPS